MNIPSGKISDGLGNIGARDAQTQELGACMDRPSGKIPDSLGNIGITDYQTQGLGAWTYHPV